MRVWWKKNDLMMKSFGKGGKRNMLGIQKSIDWNRGMDLKLSWNHNWITGSTQIRVLEEA
jgi:hypothetical protein